MHAGPLLSDCLHTLSQQTRLDFETVIVDNSGANLVRRQALPARVQVIENKSNLGYGGAINQATHRSQAPYIIVLNDDATLAPDWIATVLSSMDQTPRAGMCACRIVLSGQSVLDSAGMLLCPDGSSKQRGHGEDIQKFTQPGLTLFPSGAAAVYRRKMLRQIGGFDEKFFLYCEDTDVGLRAQWAGWTCLYLPQAVAEHRYSATAGRVSPMKAYYVERNRLFVLIKNFPFRMLLNAPMATALRYAWHLAAFTHKNSAAARFREQGNSAWQLVSIVIRAHIALFAHLPRLLRQRKEIRRQSRISPLEFTNICRTYSISPKQVAMQ